MGYRVILIKSYVVGTHKMCLSEVLLMSTTTFFHGKNKKKCQYFLVEIKHLIWRVVLSLVHVAYFRNLF